MYAIRSYYALETPSTGVFEARVLLDVQPRIVGGGIQIEVAVHPRLPSFSPPARQRVPGQYSEAVEKLRSQYFFRLFLV